MGFSSNLVLPRFGGVRGLLVPCIALGYCLRGLLKVRSVKVRLVLPKVLSVKLRLVLLKVLSVRVRQCELSF